MSQERRSDIVLPLLPSTVSSREGHEIHLDEPQENSPGPGDQHVAQHAEDQRDPAPDTSDSSCDLREGRVREERGGERGRYRKGTRTI